MSTPLVFLCLGKVILEPPDQLGRWFVTWMKLEEDMNRPEAQARELLVFEKDKDNRFVFTEV